MSIPSPYGGQNRIKLTRREYITWISITLGIVVTIFLFAFELPHFNNTFHLSRLFLWTTIVAILVGTGFIFKIKNTFKDSIDAIRASLIIYLGTIVIFFLLAHFLNRNITIGETRIETFPFLQHQLYRKNDEELVSKNLFMTYIEVDNDMKRVVSRGPLYTEGSTTGQVDIPTIKGLFGFKVAKIY